MKHPNSNNRKVQVRKKALYSTQIQSIVEKYEKRAISYSDSKVKNW